MSILPFGDDAPEPAPPVAARLAPKLRALAERGVRFGASSWKYDGWLGSIYGRQRYSTRGKVSQRRFEQECLTEYAETFPTVCGDFAFYQFPTQSYWDRLFAQTPASFTFGLKVPEHVTVLRWPGHARYGPRAGQHNPQFLDVETFARLFLDPLVPHRARVGPLIFEFGTFARRDFAEPDLFFDLLSGFLASLPGGWRYAVEIRNAAYLSPAYFAVLARWNVAHVFNAWTRMPTLDDQVRLADAFTADFTVTRALLARGRTYEAAVRLFAPYDRVQEPNPGARTALAELGRRALRAKEPAYVFVNNRLEGYAPGTIEAVADMLGVTA
jgi:uncharacterized protein YecE (DUF72 family)